MLKTLFYKTSTIKNTLFIFMTKGSFTVASLVISILVARQLGPAAFGVYALVLSVYTIFELLVTLGLDNLIIREVAKDHSKSGLFFSHGLFVGLVSASVCYMSLFLVGYLMHYPHEVRVNIALMGSLLLPAFLSYLLENIFIAHQKSKYIAGAALTRDVAMILLGAIALSIGYGVSAVIVSMLVSRLMGLLFLLSWSQRLHIKLIAPLQWAFLKNMAKLIPTFLSIGICSTVFIEMDTLILSKVLSVSDLGIYSVAKRILRFGNAFIFSVVTALFPLISESFSLSKESQTGIFKKLTIGMFLISFTVVLSAQILSGPVIRIVFGTAYLASVQYVQMLMWALVPLSLSFVFSRFLIAGHQQHKDLVALCCGLLCSFSLGLFFISKWGGIGMPVAYVIAACVMASVHYWFTRRLVSVPAVKLCLAEVI